jgi:hypothetical protein
MKKIKLRLLDFLTLEDELTKGESALISQKLSMTVKYWLNALLKNVQVETENCNNIKNELIKKYGKETNGNITIEYKVKNYQGEETISEDFLRFNDEYLPVLNIEKELEYKEFKLEDFAEVHSEGYYPVFYQLVSAPEL